MLHTIESLDMSHKKKPMKRFAEPSDFCFHPAKAGGPPGMGQDIRNGDVVGVPPKAASFGGRGDD